LLVKLRKENNNTEFISKEILINCFLDLNKLLDYETVKKIINIYDNNNGIKIEHINNLFNIFLSFFQDFIFFDGAIKKKF